MLIPRRGRHNANILKFYHSSKRIWKKIHPNFVFLRKTSYFCFVKELFDSIATQNAEIRTVANSLPPLLKYFAKSLFLNQLSLTDKNLKYKIENAEDVEKITDVPILGELPLSKKPEKGAIVVQENQNGMMEEAFRGLRTNMLFMLGASQKVVLFTSTQPGEGKSFIAGNTAVSLAYMGKKVVIVGLDIRKPGLNKVFNLSHRTEGITNYLADPEHTNLFDMIQHSDVSPNLDILPGGPIPPNPTELMARTVLEDAIEKLKERYDYIILDTAPIAIVTDTAIASRVADMCVYVCRADVTPKLGYQYINVLRDQKKFDKLATVINSIDLNSRKSGYGYKYGYGYGHKYGYGYVAETCGKKD